MTAPLTVTLNGAPRAVAARDVAALVAELQLPTRAILVEHNGVALRPDEWPGAILRDGDRLEFIRIVAGG